jgi:DivIVA domain-containing protein
MAEQLVPEDIENVSFPTSLRGYDRDSVDIFLQEVAAAYEAVLNEARSARAGAQKPYRSLGEEMGDLLQHAKDSAEQTQKTAEEEARRSVERATEDARNALTSAQEQAANILREAEKEAAVKIQEAADTVAQLESMETEARARIRTLREDLVGLTGELGRLDPAPAPSEARSPDNEAPLPPVGDPTEQTDMSILTETISATDGSGSYPDEAGL